ncbi:hypothetical protein QFC19_004050 [Naganishia cerealis]|uniref:Uncharacterized protein n=1 Tax=Naganishia cerealis TaxID=610337 RepID=A0ACC2VYF3_9TREE|nr:hypothetical protein QFC19_004050 [Naganishia cerealis]
MALKRNGPLLMAIGVGVAGGYYAFNQPLKDYTAGKETQSHVGGADSRDGKGDAAKKDGPKSASPHPSLAYGGASPVDPEAKTVAGTSSQGRKGNSADPDVKLRSTEDAKKQDGSGGGGVGVKEMKERKAAGQGLPSAQGGGVTNQARDAQKPYSA